MIFSEAHYEKESIHQLFFPTLLFIIFIFAGLTSFLQLFGFCAAHFDVLADSLVLAIVFCLVYMFACVELAKAAERYIDDSWWLAEKYGVSDPRVLTSARALMLLGALLCAGLAASGLFLPYFSALPKLLLLFAGLAVSVLLILRPCARLRRACNKERL